MLTGTGSFIEDVIFYLMLITVAFLAHFYRDLLQKKEHGDKKRRNDLNKIPGPLILPFIGTVWVYLWKYKSNKVHEAYQDMIRRYGGVVREVVAGGNSIVSVSSREDIEKVLRYPSKYPYRPPSDIIVNYRRSRPDRFASSGIANEQGEIWYNLRSKLTPQLTSKQTMLCFLPELNVIGDDLMQLLKQNRNENSEVHNFDQFACRYGLESVCTLVLGERMTFMDHVLSETAKKLSEAIIQRFKSERDDMYSWRDYTKTSDYQKFLKCEEDLYSVADEIVQKASTLKETTHSEVKCILLSIVERLDLDDREKKSALIDFVAAGIQTLSSSLSFIMYLMAKNPEAQQKVYAELEEIAPNSNHITGNDLAKMAYTKACILETSRMIPVAFALRRVLEEDTVLSGYHLQAGTSVMCHTRVACGSDANFDRAGDFLPERWLAGNPLQRQTQAAAASVFAPFGHGRRICPGKRFVEHALLVTFAKIIREFHIDFFGELDVQFEFVLSPKTPVTFKLKDR